MPTPAWLPAMLDLEGEWEEIVDGLYDVFCRDVKQARLQYNGLPLWWDQRIFPDDKYEEGFWHVISETDRTSGKRNPDFRRAEKLSWFGPIIQNCGHPEVSCWEDAESGGGPRTYLWLEELNYVIVLKKLSKVNRAGIKFEVMMLVTAYCTDGARTQEKLRRGRARCH